MIATKDIRIALRQLLADPAYSLVVVIGLAVALAASLLIATLVDVALRPGSEALVPERTVQIEHRDTTRQQATLWDSTSPFVIRRALLDAHAPLTAITRYKLDDPTSVRVGDRVFKLKVSYADPDFTKLFAITPLAGNLHQVLTHPDQVALIESTATRLFGDTPAMGKILSIGGQRITVGAILPNPQAGSLINTDMLLGFDSLPAMQWGERQDLLTEWGMNTGNVWAQLAPGAGVAELEALVAQSYAKSDYVAHLPPEMKTGDTPSKLFRATPFSRLALDGAGNEGQSHLVWSLLAAAVTMLLLATINYTNLSTVRTLKRQREIGLRKSLGASAHQIVTLFVLESVVVVTGASALAILLAWLLVPALGDLVNQPLLADTLFRSWHLPMVLLLALQLGLATGLYPAWVAVGTRCAEALAGRGQEESRIGMQARRALTVVQFAAAIVLSAMAMMVVLQSYAASHQDLGFKTNDMLGVDIPGNAPAATASAARDAIARLPGVKSVSIAFDLPGRDQSININLIKRGDQAAQEMRFMPVTPDYFGQYGIPVLAGRNLADKENDAILLDEQAAQILGYANPADAVGQSVQLGEKTTMIRGVVANTRLESARQATMPKVYAAKQKLLGAISVETADIAATRQQIEALWPRYFPEDAPFIDTIQNYIDARYADDLRFGELIGMASIISLLLAGFGVYALAAYTVRRKTREIVLRKLYGAPSLAIASLLGREFGLLLALGAAIGLPLAALLVARFQAGFVVQAPVGGWAMLAGLIMTALLTVLATGRHIRIALRLPPVQALQG